MRDNNFNFFRTELRKRLGRILFYPQNIDEYIPDIVELIENNEKMFMEYIDNTTNKEKELLSKVMHYLEDTHTKTHIVKIIKRFDKT